MGKFTSTKVFDGFSTVFRQWKAETTHCKYLHGYGISFKLWFQGDLDDRNWVWDFGGMKRAKGKIDGMSPKDWFDYMFDHTFVVAEDDPFKESFLYDKVNPFISEETEGRVKISKVEFREHGKNSAIYEPR